MIPGGAHGLRPVFCIPRRPVVKLCNLAAVIASPFPACGHEVALPLTQALTTTTLSTAFQWFVRILGTSFRVRASLRSGNIRPMPYKIFRILAVLLISLVLMGGEGGCPFEFEDLFPSDPDGDADLDHQAASWVIAQQDLDSNELDREPDADVLTEPGSPRVHEGIVYVTDQSNNRVAAWNGIPDTDNVPADFVLGQTAMTDGDAGFGAGGMTTPIDLEVANRGLALADFGNSRVMLWDAPPESGPQDADGVLGAPSPDDGPVVACTPENFDGPWGIAFAGSRVLVSDFNHHRILVWDDWPESDGQRADSVLGQENRDTCFENRDTGLPGADTLASPAGLWSDGERLAVADRGNHRVLLWDEFPEDGEAADRVLGQPDMEGNLINADGIERGFNAPVDVHYDGDRLFVADRENHRVLIWDGWPDEDQQQADSVLGQPDLESSVQNNTGDDSAVNARSLASPTGIWSDGERILVADRDNDRVLIYEVPEEDDEDDDDNDEDGPGDPE